MSLKIRNSLIAGSLLAIPIGASAQVAQEVVDLNVIEQIREEGLERSHMDQMAQYMTDVMGPRLTASPGIRRAQAWTVEKFEEWGLQNIDVESWGRVWAGLVAPVLQRSNPDSLSPAIARAACCVDREHQRHRNRTGNDRAG